MILFQDKTMYVYHLASPDDLIDSKEAFKVSKFLQSLCKDKDMDFKSTMEKCRFCYKFSDNLQKILMNKTI